MKVAVVGATGLVGKTMLNVLQERNFPVDEIIPVASARSVGTEVIFNGKKHAVISIEDAVKARPALAMFSAGASVSLEWAPFFAQAGTTVIDNSSAWRMDNTKKLVVPEVNAYTLTKDDKIIANPNCSTIQMVVALYPLHNKYKVKRVVVSTYQAVSGTGHKGIAQMMDERSDRRGTQAYPHSIDMNVIPHIDVFLENDYTKEEIKMVNETRKIMGDDTIRLTATAVRVPVMAGHSEAINVEFENEFEINEVKQLLTQGKGIIVIDNPSRNFYPMPLNAEGRDEVFVGRIRRDESQPKTLNLWVVSDNLRKGAATNAVQIAEYLAEQQFIS